ncbi:transporter substrate-binding domain-containing protein [Methanospirillum sp.]|uniref:transporter substrate-binding domain-containing protein n=2 Tax=Methanospirillum sp. TaxID=45200 RepID=UPI002D1FB4E2|nr:transporter substrate-binding domain-containing protein [Methanospirillum sp.]
MCISIMNPVLLSKHSYLLFLLLLGVLNGFTCSFGFADTPSSDMPPLSLTPEEQQWIATHPVIRICPDPNYPPFEILTPDGEYEGISADLIRIIADMAGFTLEVVPCENWSQCIEKIKNREIDILGAVYISDLRTQYLSYSDPIYSSPLLIITRNTAPSDLTITDLYGKSVAVVDGYTSHLLLATQYPDIYTVVVPDVALGLEKVVFGSADAYVGDLATAAYHTEKLGFTNLQVSGVIAPSDTSFHNLAFGIRSDQPVLVSIINKGLRSLPESRKKAILTKWIPASLISPLINRQILIAAGIVIAFFCIIIIGFFVWNRSLRKAVAEKTRQLVDELDERKRILTELQQKNDELSAAYEQIAATEYELKRQYRQLIESQEELKEQERILRQVRFSIDQSHDMMMWLDKNGNIRDVSGSVLSALGYAREEYNSMNMSAIDPRFTIHAGFDLSGRDDIAPIRYETEFLTKEKTPIPVEVSLISYEYAEETMILLSARDIRERRMMEELKKKAFTQIDKNIEQFAILNDQIRNPLTILMIYAEEMDSPDGEKILEEILKIDTIVDKLDKGLLESDKVRAFLRRYYNHTEGDDFGR